MKVNELENILDISRANIRFYEKEGLLCPKRDENGYRNYSLEDVDTLRQIILCRKLGLTIDEIRELQQGETDLTEILIKNQQRIKEQISSLEGALYITEKIIDNQEQWQCFNAETYMEMVSIEEQKGNTFFDIARDYARFEGELLDNVTGGGKKSPLAIGIFLTVIAIIRGFISVSLGESFFSGFCNTVIVLAILSILMFPLFALRKRSKAKEMYRKLALGLALLFLIFVVILTGVMLLNSRLHFLF